MYSLAEALHKTLDEIGQMSHAEFAGWIAYYKIKNEEREAERRGRS